MGSKPSTPRPSQRRQKPIEAAGPASARLAWPVVAGLLALVCLVAYWNSFRAEFLLDNQSIILKDTRLRTADWQSVRNIFTTHYWWPSFESTLFRPLTTLSYWFNYCVLGNRENPFGYHVVNLLVHWSNALLAFALVRTVTRKQWLALFSAAVLACHPLTVESVTNVVGRADLLAGMSVVAGLLLYRRFLDAAGRQRLVYLACLAITYLVGVFCKESAVVLPGLMLLHDVVFPVSTGPTIWMAVRRSLARAWPAYVGVLPGLVLLLGTRWVMFRNSPLFGQLGGDNPIAIAPFWTGVMTAVKVGGYYLALLIWPAKLSCDYSYNQITLFGWTLASGQDWHAWVALAALAALAAGAVAAWHRHRGILFFLGFAAATFLPTSNLLFPIGTIMGERLMYLPLLGLTAAFALAITAAIQRLQNLLPDRVRRAISTGLRVAAVVVIAALITRTVVRNEDWTSGLRLWSVSAQTAPNSFKVYRALASITMESDASGGRVDEALEIATRGLRIVEQAPLPLPHMPAALYEDIGIYYSDKARLLASRGQSDESRAALDRALTLLKRAAEIDHAINQKGRERLIGRGLTPDEIHDTGTGIIYRNLGAAYLETGDPDQAIAVLSYLEHIDPESSDGHYARGVAEGGAAELEKSRGNQQLASEHLERAAVSLIEATLLKPDDLQAWRTLERVYNGLAPSPEAVVVVNGKPTLNAEHPLAPRHLKQACVLLVRQLVEAGLHDDAARWRRQTISQFGLSPEMFDR